MTKKTTAPVTISLYRAEELDKRIVRLKVAGTNLQTEMHKLACSVLSCFGENNDVRKATNFVLKLSEAMPEMSRVNALKQWFEAYAPIKFSTTEEIKAGAAAAYYVKDGKFKLGDAMATPFWKFKAQEGVEFKPVDIATEIKRLLSKIDTHNKGAEAAGVDRIDAGLVNALTMMQGGVLPASVSTMQ